MKAAEKVVKEGREYKALYSDPKNVGFNVKKVIFWRKIWFALVPLADGFSKKHL